MLPPGWNVTEPFSLALKLYEVTGALGNASEDARLFSAKIQNFGVLLNDLQTILDEDGANKVQEHQDLYGLLLNCQDCVERCQNFTGQFKNLSEKSGGKLAVAGQATRWVWQDKKAMRLKEQIDSQMNHIGCALQVKSL